MYIKVNKRTVFVKEFYKRGIKYTEHIYDFCHKCFYNFRELKQVYVISDNSFF